MKILTTHLQICAALLLVAASGAACVSAQKTVDKTAQNQTNAAQNRQPEKTSDAKMAGVKQIDLPGLKAILKENVDAKRPLLVNFWATWCSPCREEFPELVKIDREFRPKGLQFVTVSLDDLADKDTGVAEFLKEMRAEAMPAFLLKTADEQAAIAAIAPNYNGALPLTILYDASGKTAYMKMGVIKPDVLRQEIAKVLPESK